MRLHRRIGAAVGLAGLVLGSCGGDGGGDLDSFCAAVEALAEEDPFGSLEVASPEEMRTAFDQLRAGVAEIEASAPDDLDGRADRYLGTVDELVDQLRGAGFDPRNLDALAYRSATSDYEAAAVSIENAAAADC